MFHEGKGRCRAFPRVDMVVKMLIASANADLIGTKRQYDIRG